MQEPQAIPEEPGSPQALGPIIQFKGAWTFDTQSVLEVSPDGTRAFVADGAAIAFLDLTSISGTPPQPAVIHRVPLENAAPLALRYWKHPVSNTPFLFIAGGTMGLWRMTLCSNLLALPPATPSKCICQVGNCDPYVRTRLDIVEDATSFQRKRCIDLAIVEGNPGSGGDPLLLALFSARAAIALPLGPTELRAYKLKADGTVEPYGTHLMLGTALGLPSEAVGSALAIDPADPSSAYVSMGIGWLYKVNLTSSLFAASAYGPSPYGCPLTPCAAGEKMRSLAIVRTPLHGSVLYAALDYGRILEYQLGPTPATRAFTVSTPNGTGKYPNRIQAVAQGERVLIALGSSFTAGTSSDTNFIRTTGGWTNFHQSNSLADPNGAPDQTPPLPENKEVFFYLRDLNAAPSLTSLGARPVKGPSWGSLVLRELSPTLHRVHAGPSLVAYDVFDAFGTAPTIGTTSVFTYATDGITPTDGTISLLNSEITYFGLDGAAGMMLVDASGGFQQVAHADLCGGVAPMGIPSCVGTEWPNPFVYGSVQEVANWVDPDGVHEWFVAGGPTWRRIFPGGPMGCDTDANDDCSPSNPCGAGPYYWWNNRHHNNTSGVPDVGWFVVRMKTSMIGGSPPSTDLADMKWWQLDSPTTSGAKAEGHDYLTSQVDPRQVIVGGVSQGPRYVHCIRTGSNRGLKVFDRASIIQKTMLTCGGTSPGWGEHMATPDIQEYVTHPEVETAPQGCVVNVPFAGGFWGKPRHQFNNKSDVFSILAPDGTQRWIIAVAEGWVTTADDGNQTSSCRGLGTWSEKFGKALVGFYDITNPSIQPWPPPPPGPVAPIRVGMSTSLGHAWAVKAKTYPNGQTYAFVADFTGKLVVFPASYSDLFNPAKSPYLPGDTLDPAKIYRFPGDPSDLMPANCIDLDLEDDLLYCALGRAGLGVVNIQNPLDPVLIHLIDTPGIVEGIARRRIDNKDQLVVGDTRCGMRLYGRVGE